MAIEDAAVLGRLFSHVSDKAQIKPLLEAYQALRLPRTAETQASSRLNQKIFHLPDGPEQEARDASMRSAMEVELRMLERERNGEPAVLDDALEGNYNQWADRRKNEQQFGYDAEAVADQWWQEHGKLEIGILANA